jgi:peptidyl-dipeptidase Dcp
MKTHSFRPMLFVILLLNFATMTLHSQNPLLENFNTPYETAPFDQVKPKHFVPAFEQAIQEAKAEINTITENSQQATFENTIAALDFSGEKLGRISSIFFNINSAETTEEIQQIAQQVSPMLSEFNNDVKLNEKLFQKIKAVWDQKESLNLTPEQVTLLDNTYKSFSRNGALLSKTDQEKLREIDKKLSALRLTFGENVLADTHAFELHLTHKNELSGLPEGTVEAAHQEAIQRGKDGWVFTLDYPSYLAIMKYSERRELREKMAKAYGKKGFQDNENNNEKALTEIAQLRLQRAQLLGYNTHAQFVLEERMAESPEKVNEFLDNLIDKAHPHAKKEFEELTQFAHKNGLKGNLEIWDGAYYTEKLRKEKFQLDDEVLKPYFKLDNVLQGVFDIAGKLYGLHFDKVNDIDTYHPEVNTYKVTDTNGDFIAVFYTDFFPRKGKRNGAWMTSYKNQWKKEGENSRPHVSIVCNFTRPTESKPSLLTFNEVTTLFHEFGHALHGMLANTTYPGLSGTSVYWDFVELPSQMMENWAYEPEALALFAKHYETGEMIPMEYVEKIKESANFMEGMATVRQLSFGLLDMAWHGTTLDNFQDVKSFERKAMAPTQIYPIVDENLMSTSFSHIFQGGYSSGYYSYKWAEVLDADAFAYFKETGIFNQETAAKMKDFILSQGGSEHPMTLYKRFRGREPQPDALLKRAGLDATLEPKFVKSNTED